MKLEIQGHNLQANCSCLKAKILFVLTTDMPGYVDSTLGLLGHLEARMTEESEMHIIDVSNFLPLYSSKKSNGFSPILNFINLNKKFHLRTVSPGTNRMNFPKPELVNGIHSYLYSFFMSNRISGGLLAKAQSNRVTKATHSVYDIVSKLLKDEHFCSSVVLNGRDSISAATRVAAQDNSVQIFFWEHSPEHKIYFCNHPPQDYFSYKRELESFIPSSEQIKDAETWLDQRTELLSSDNQYSHGWKSAQIDSEKKEIDLCIFTSSQDEFWALGELMPKKDYEDFYSQIIKVLSRREQKDEHLVIRMHPNTVNKSVIYAIREARKARRLKRKFTNLRIVWPHQRINSYDLVRSAHHVLVENSTLGVEAAWLGVPVTYLRESNYVGLSSRTLYRRTPRNNEIDVSMTVEHNKKVALADVALIRSHYQLCYETNENLRWTKLSLLKSVASKWTIVFLAIRLLNPRFNKLIFCVASRIR